MSNPVFLQFVSTLFAIEINFHHSDKVSTVTIPNRPIKAVSISCANGSIACPRIAGKDNMISSCVGLVTFPFNSALILSDATGVEISFVAL